MTFMNSVRAVTRASDFLVADLICHFDLEEKMIFW